MKSRVRELVEQGDRLFGKRAPLHALWQTMAENFCPIRAEFTTTRALGDEYASHLMTGRPVLAHRDLSNALSAMLRPRGQAWFHARTGDENINNDAGARQWLDAKADVMRRIIYDPRGQFIRATKQGDHDFTAFGQTVISVDINSAGNGLLYRAWHLRDVAWCENDELVIDVVHHNWKHEARALIRKFPATVASSVKTASDKEPYREIKCRRVVLPADDYDLSPGKKPKNPVRFPFVSIMVDCENDTILEEVPARRVPYVIPRWQTVPGSQYAHSPATVVALPDARLLQQISLTLLEAGQKAVDPPLKATREAIIGGVNVFAGGITWVDAEYDEKMGPALERLIDRPGELNWGEAREAKLERVISEAFYLNVINLPEATGAEKMTAYETQERVKEYIRRALPLFEPMEVEYNGGLCEMTWNLAMDMNAFGSFADMPPMLRGREINWQFESPLQAANERVKSQAFQQSAELLAMAAQIDPAVRYDFNLDKAFRDALGGVAPADWVVPVEAAAAAKEQAEQLQQAEAAAQAMATGADVATRMGTAVKSAGEAQQVLQQAGVV
ncbi:MAG: hypothetical protein JWN71_2791 [Xanthobacteraceae bacterium]|nr:hypothetical protein [Xanthobacteraceae bacterium]